MRLGLFCLPATGHLNPAHALGRRLRARGHVLVCFQTAIARAAVRAAGLEFFPLDEATGSDSAPATQHYVRARVNTITAIGEHATRVLRSHDRIRGAALDGVVVDHADLAAGTVAQHVGLPFVSVAFSPPFYLHSRVPAPAFGWKHSSGFVARVRNQCGNVLVERALAPVLRQVNRQRRVWKLPELRRLNDAFSGRALITQLPACLDLPWEGRPAQLIHAGPFVDDAVRYSMAFPWARLDGRPLVYASMGTVRNESVHLFRVIAEACAGEDVQLVLSLGGGRLDAADLGELPGRPIVVEFAPQIEVLKRTALMITHAGLNSTLEALACGVPLVAIPIADDQPGVAERVRRVGAGEVLSWKTLTAVQLRHRVRRVLGTRSYRTSAQDIATQISAIDGVGIAVAAIEAAFRHTDVPDVSRLSEQSA